LDGSKEVAEREGVEQLKIEYLGKGWQCGKMILVERGEDCEYVIPTSGIGNR
jgi:hypothetical protein